MNDDRCPKCFSGDLMLLYDEVKGEYKSCQNCGYKIMDKIKEEESK